MSLSATQGSSATNTITANLVTGSPQPVSFSASGLPQGGSTSFSQTTCSPTCSSLLTIATGASTPGGTYTITVTGAGGGVTRTTSFALAVNAATTSPPPEGVIFASPSSIAFQTTVGGPLPPTQSIMMTVPGGGRWSTNDTSPFYDSSACWSGAGRSCASGTITTLTPIPSFFPVGAAGTYSAPLTISSAGYPDLVIPVTLTVLQVPLRPSRPRRSPPTVVALRALFQ